MPGSGGLAVVVSSRGVHLAGAAADHIPAGTLSVSVFVATGGVVALARQGHSAFTEPKGAGEILSSLGALDDVVVAFGNRVAARMVAIPDLQVRMFLDISRPQGDTSLGAMIVQRYAHRFRTQEWPEGVRLPEIWYDPRALEIGKGNRACLHSKCIVADGEITFITSANLTEAAQQRNIEVGTLIRSRAFSGNLEKHFTVLSEQGLLKKT